MILIFPKTRVYDGSNSMNNIFLLLIQVAQCQFQEGQHFLAHPLTIKLFDNV